MTLIDVMQIGLLLIIIGMLAKRAQVASSPGSKKPKQRIVMDSCALIDGRVVAITEAGFGAEEFVIPQFIIHELQLLADGHDSHKRERARFGLDVAAKLQADPLLTVVIDQTNYPEIPKTDDKLIALSQKLNARLYTTDFNLNKVAVLAGLQVMNVNELAHSLRPEALPGDKRAVKIVQKGQGRDQGVGYMEDGTMVVVDNAGKAIGKTLTVIVERMHQTVAGKMIFAHPEVLESDGTETPVTTQSKNNRRRKPNAS